MSSSSAAAAAPPLTPTVYWSQSSRAVDLKIEMRDANKQGLKIKVTGNQLEVSGVTKANVLSSCVRLSLAKSGGGAGERWPRLLAEGTPEHKHKVKVDWERWMDEEEEEAAKKRGGEKDARGAAGSAYTPSEREELRNSFLKATQQSQPGGVAPNLDATRLPPSFQVSPDNPALAMIHPTVRIKLSYLLAYNAMVWMGLVWILCLAVHNIVLHATGAPKIAVDGAEPTLMHEGGWMNGLLFGMSTLHARVGQLEYMVQGLASLELVHAITGLVRGRVLPSFLLNGGRDIILFGLIYVFPSVQIHWATGLLYVVWCFGDALRFLFYLQQLVHSSREAELVAESWFGSVVVQMLKTPSLGGTLQYLRYTIPLFLLPLGFLSELMVLKQSMPHAAQIALAGGITLAHVLQAYSVFAYVLGAPFLWFAVRSQRNKKLAGGKKEKRSKTTTTTTSSSSSSSSASNQKSKKEN